jgi:site-specific recombinase
MGAACLAAGLLGRVLSWFLRSHRAEALKHADEALAEDGGRGVTVLGMFRFGSALLMLIGVVLVSVSFIAYARF